MVHAAFDLGEFTCVAGLAGHRMPHSFGLFGLCSKIESD
jgi:hypothetical protein